MLWFLLCGSFIYLVELRSPYVLLQRSTSTVVYEDPVQQQQEPPVVPMDTPSIPKQFENIDVDFDDPQACTVYATDIMKSLRDQEVCALSAVSIGVLTSIVQLAYMPSPNYLSKQKDLNEPMRAILIDWLVQVHFKFKLVQETLYLTVNIIDRFLGKKQIMRNKLQLVGITSMLIASKYEDIYAPVVRDFTYICDRAYTRREILDMEQVSEYLGCDHWSDCHAQTILSTLDFALVVPYPLHFLRRFSKAANVDQRTHTLAKYLCEMSVPEYGLVKYLPSTVAASALCLALKMTRYGTWDDTMIHYSRYTEEQLMPCMQELNKLHTKSPTATLQAVRKKYSKQKYLRVAKEAAITL